MKRWKIEYATEAVATNGTHRLLTHPRTIGVDEVVMREELTSYLLREGGYRFVEKTPLMRSVVMMRPPWRAWIWRQVILIDNLWWRLLGRARRRWLLHSTQPPSNETRFRDLRPGP